MTDPYYHSGKATLYLGDCLDMMREVPDNSVDAIVCDPPAGISFMGKHWDGDKGGRREWIAGMAEIFTEALRVLKPGGHAFVWALPRTSHWTATALEDAGFEIRDRVAHIFGSGFPKSLAVDKAIDKAAGAEREVIGRRKRNGGPTGMTPDKGWHSNPNGFEIDDSTVVMTLPATDAARTWDGWGTALKPAVEDWWLCRKPLSEPTVAANVLRWGTGAVNVEACRIGFSGNGDGEWHSTPGSGTDGRPKSNNGIYGQFGTKAEPKENVRYNPSGRWPANLVLSHHPECRQVGAKRVKNNGGVPQTPLIKDSAVNFVSKERTSFVHYFDPDGYETVDAWECVDGGMIIMPVIQFAGRAISGLDTISSILATVRIIIQGLRQSPEVPDSHKLGKHNWLDYDALHVLGWSRLPSFRACCPSCRHFCGELARKAQAACQVSALRLADVLESACQQLEQSYTQIHPYDGLLASYGDPSLFETSPGTEGSNTVESCPLALTVWAGMPSDRSDILLGEIAPSGVGHNKGENNTVEDAPCDMTRSSCRNVNIDTACRALFCLASDIASLYGLLPVYHQEVELASCAVAMLDAQSGELKSGAKHGVYNGWGHGRGIYGDVQPYEQHCESSTGGASRYFAVFPADGDATRMRYVPKASRQERNRGVENPGPRRKRNDTTGGKYAEAPNPLDSNLHPTVKPIALMRWLCRLIAPPNGIILDPFMGSGSTGCAAVLEGFRFIGIEREADYIEIAKRRIAFWAAEDLPLMMAKR